jgi:uncharacterized protein (DUF2336 family)
MAVDLALFREIERAGVTGSEPRRRQLLQRVTDLFIVGSQGYSDEEIALFDDVITKLAADIELSARALLAVRLAPISNAPPKAIRALAFDHSIDVAGPVLSQSERLDDSALVENASKNGQEHLLAISRRRSLSEFVTDVLVSRGDCQVVLSTVANGGAKFSDAGFAILVKRSEGDDRLAVCVGSRPEIPASLLLELLESASHAVRAKLEILHPNARGEVSQAVADATDQLGAEVLANSPSGIAAQKMVAALRQSGELNDGKVGAFAKAARFEETAASLAVICDLPIEFVWSAMLRADTEIVLILAKASDLSWSTFKSILLLCAGRHFTAGSDVAHALARFEQLRLATAVEIVRFYRARAKSGMPPRA